MTHWLDKVVLLLKSDTADLRTLALMCRRDPTTFYVGASLDGIDLRGQDVRGLEFTNLAIADILTDERTKTDPPLQAPTDYLEGPDASDSWKDASPEERATSLCALDIGSYKTASAILLASEGPFLYSKISVSGFGLVESSNLRSRTTYEVDATAQAIGHAVERAERASGHTVSGAVVTTSQGDIDSVRVQSVVSLGRQPVNDADLARAIAMALTKVRLPARRIIHVLPVRWTVDNLEPVQDPRGTLGQSLVLDMLVASAAASHLTSVSHSMELAHLDVQGIVAGPLATSLAVLSQEELGGNTICLDFGHDSTGIAVFAGRAVIYIGAVSIGGRHVTNSIADALNVPHEVAQAIKHGVESLKTTEQGMVSFPYGRGTISVHESDIESALNTSVSEILDAVLERLSQRALAVGESSVVLAGGASQLKHVQSLATRAFSGSRVRLGRPRGIKIMSPDGGAELAAALGVIRRSVFGPREAVSARKLLRLGLPISTARGNNLSRAAAWLRDNL